MLIMQMIEREIVLIFFFKWKEESVLFLSCPRPDLWRNQLKFEDYLI